MGFSHVYLHLILISMLVPFAMLLDGDSPRKLPRFRLFLNRKFFSEKLLLNFFRVDVEIFEDKRCEEMQAHSAKEMICAGRFGGGKDACQGDSGRISYTDHIR